MEVNGNDPTFTGELDQQTGRPAGSNIPIRLEIASRILAGIAGNSEIIQASNGNGDVLVKRSLSLADALIEAHNRSIEGD